jgi:hypothetical protein
MAASVQAPQPSYDWKEAAGVCIDAAGDIGGGLAMLGLPLLVMMPGLAVTLVLSLPFLVPVILLAVVGGLLLVPVVLIAGLIKLFR